MRCPQKRGFMLDSKRLALVIALLGALLPACGGTHFEVETPSAFVALDDEQVYDYRATNAHGVVVSVRELPNEPVGDVSFWTDAIRNRLRMNGGYALLDERDVQAASGETGRQMRYGRDQNGHPYLYWVTLFVGPERLHLVEAGGPREEFEAVESAVEASLASLAIR